VLLDLEESIIKKINVIIGDRVGATKQANK